MTKTTIAACVLVAAMAAACTKKNPAFCTSSAECTDPATPFCDVNGTFGDETNDCIAMPLDAGVDAFIQALDAPPGGCTPGEVLSCTTDVLTTCSADGHTTTPSSCALGCSTSGATRCLAFTPSNGLGSAMNAAGSATDVVIPRGSTINTDTGVVLDSGSNAVAVTTELITQTTGPKIRVLLGKSFSIDDVTATGSAALAFVAPGQIHIIGKLDAGGHGAEDGPGAIPASSGSACVGGNGGGAESFGTGAGGGGNATVGGSGGADTSPGGVAGAAQSASTALVGGCDGGARKASLESAPGGGGGGAVQIDSLTSVTLDTSGQINVGGGGGVQSTGGGSAGRVIIEAPLLTIDGAASGLVANGGAGGACNMIGADGGFSTSPAAAPQCAPESAGNGGTEAVSAASAMSCASGSCPGLWGGGGGSVGLLSIATREGGFSQVSNPLISGVTKASVLATH